jgi:hypothetical protein
MKAFVLAMLVLCPFAWSQPFIWKNVAIGGGGFVTGIIPSKSENGLMYCRTDVGGAYRWNNATSKWIPLLDWNSSNETTYQGVETLALDPNASNKVYMLVGTSYFNYGNTAILRSDDYGATYSITDVSAQFRAHGNGMGRQNGERLAVDPNLGSILWCGSRANGLFKSTDFGATWSNVSFPVTTTANGNGINMVVFDPAGTTGSATQTFFVGVSQTTNNLYKTTNGGASFTAVAGAPTGLMPQRAVLASDKTLYVVYGNNEGPWNVGSGQVWKLNTITGIWTNITPAGYTVGFGGVSVDPVNSNRVIISTINAYWGQYNDGTGTVWGDRILLTNNGGSSWTDLVNSGIVVNPNGVTWIYGHSIHWAGCVEFNPFNTAQAHIISGNGLFTCDNVNAATTTWKFNSIGIEETVPLDIVSITGGPLVSVIGDYDGFRHTDVTAFAPIHTPRMGTTTGLAFAALADTKLVRVGNAMYYSNDQGLTWTQTTSLNGTQGKVALTANGSVILHCPGGSNTFYRSINNGTNWTTCNGISIGDGIPVADMVNTNKVYAYNNTNGAFMVSTDAGQNFTTASNIGNGGSRIIRTVPGQEGHIWVAMYNGGLRRSTNSGTTFTSIAGVTYCAAVGLGKAAPSATYHAIYIWGTVGGVTGVFRSIDQGASWLRINDDANEFGGPGNGQFVIGDMNVYGRVYMSTVGRGIVYAESDIPAPVSLLSFNVKEKNGTAELIWETVSEENNAYFEIQKSVDGKTFSAIGTRAGAGNSNTLLKYTFEDAAWNHIASWYRLKQVDVDGTFSYSDIRVLKSREATITLFPNPCLNEISVTLPSDTEFDFQLLDVNGKLVLEQTKLVSGQPIALEGIASGVYYAVIIEPGLKSVQKMLVR